MPGQLRNKPSNELLLVMTEAHVVVQSTVKLRDKLPLPFQKTEDGW